MTDRAPLASLEQGAPELVLEGNLCERRGALGAQTRHATNIHQRYQHGQRPRAHARMRGRAV